MISLKNYKYQNHILLTCKWNWYILRNRVLRFRKASLFHELKPKKSTKHAHYSITSRLGTYPKQDEDPSMERLILVVITMLDTGKSVHWDRLSGMWQEYSVCAHNSQHSLLQRKRKWGREGTRAHVTPGVKVGCKKLGAKVAGKRRARK